MLTAERLAGPVPGREPADRAVPPGSAARVSALAVRLARRGDAQAAAVLVLTGFAIRFSAQHHGGLHPHLAIALALASTAPLLLLRVLPIPALALPVLCGAVFITTARLEWPSASIACWLAALALCPLYLRRAQALGGLALAEASVAAALFVPPRINATPWDATVAELLAAAAAWWAGETVRSRRDTRAERAAVAHRLRTLSERDAVARERARIARELHDVVAHHVSTIAVRAATLPYEVGDLPEPARTGLAEIAEGARAALADLRAVLGVLRSSTDKADGEPQPRLDDLPMLVARVQTTGVRVVFRIVGEQRPLPGSVQVCGYRIVQEGLTNAVRHAPGGKVHVEVGYGADELAVAVRDDGGGAVSAAAEGGGYGLIGMRERVATLGGTLRTGPRAGGGFEIVAVLPCPAARDGRG